MLSASLLIGLMFGLIILNFVELNSLMMHHDILSVLMLNVYILSVLMLNIDN